MSESPWQMVCLESLSTQLHNATQFVFRHAVWASWDKFTHEVCTPRNRHGYRKSKWYDFTSCLHCLKPVLFCKVSRVLPPYACHLGMWTHGKSLGYEVLGHFSVFWTPWALLGYRCWSRSHSAISAVRYHLGTGKVGINSWVPTAIFSCLLFWTADQIDNWPKNPTLLNPTFNYGSTTKGKHVLNIFYRPRYHFTENSADLSSALPFQAVQLRLWHFRATLEIFSWFQLSSSFITVWRSKSRRYSLTFEVTKIQFDVRSHEDTFWRSKSRRYSLTFEVTKIHFDVRSHEDTDWRSKSRRYSSTFEVTKIIQIRVLSILYNTFYICNKYLLSCFILQF